MALINTHFIWTIVFNFVYLGHFGGSVLWRFHCIISHCLRGCHLVYIILQFLLLFCCFLLFIFACAVPMTLWSELLLAVYWSVFSVVCWSVCWLVVGLSWLARDPAQIVDFDLHPVSSLTNLRFDVHVVYKLNDYISIKKKNWNLKLICISISYIKLKDSFAWFVYLFRIADSLIFLYQYL